jgi:ABC-type multidrug transport system fused ATPase/permease subunit
MYNLSWNCLQVDCVLQGAALAGPLPHQLSCQLSVQTPSRPQVLGLGSVAVVLARSALLVVGSIAASRQLHQRLLTKMLRLPMSFYDAQPTGTCLLCSYDWIVSVRAVWFVILQQLLLIKALGLSDGCGCLSQPMVYSPLVLTICCADAVVLPHVSCACRPAHQPLHKRHRGS